MVPVQDLSGRVGALQEEQAPGEGSRMVAWVQEKAQVVFEAAVPHLVAMRAASAAQLVDRGLWAVACQHAQGQAGAEETVERVGMARVSLLRVRSAPQAPLTARSGGWQCLGRHPGSRMHGTDTAAWCAGAEAWREEMGQTRMRNCHGTVPEEAVEAAAWHASGDACLEEKWGSTASWGT